MTQPRANSADAADGTSSRRAAPPKHKLAGMLTSLPVVSAVLTGLLLTAIALKLSPYLRGPAPWPPEWRWTLRQEVTLRGLPGTLGFAAVLAALMFVSATRIAMRRPRLIGALLLAATTLSSFGLHFSLIATKDGRSATDMLVQRTMSPTLTSYYTVAVSESCRDVGQFVRQYADLLPEMPIHAATHPLCPILYYRGLLHVLQQHPGFADEVIRLAGWLEVDRRYFTTPDQELLVATAVTGALLLMMMSSLSCLAVAALARVLGFTPQQAIRAAIIWAVVPGFALMVPEFDRFLALPVTSAAALLAIAFRPRTSTTWRGPAALGAGVMGGVAVLFSYGSAVFLVYGALVAVAAALPARPKLLRHIVVPACVAAGVTVLIFFLPSFFGHDSVRALMTSLQIHRVNVTQPRSYSSWIVFNLWDTVVFLGFPLAVFWIRNATSSISSLIRRAEFSGASAPALSCAAATAGLLLIDLSGTVRGEAGRIWIPIMPFLLISALATQSRHATANGNRCDETAGTRALTRPGLVFVLLVACCLVLRRTWNLP